MKYEAIPPRTRDALESDLAGGDTRAIALALIAASLHEPDRTWVEGHLVRFLTHDDAWVRGAAAIAAGHLARIHGSLDVDRLVPMIASLRDDRRTAGQALNALDDIAQFVRPLGQS